MKKTYVNPAIKVMALNTQNMIALSIPTESGEIDSDTKILSKRQNIGETTPSQFWRQNNEE
jgi:hypothetical protein